MHSTPTPQWSSPLQRLSPQPKSPEPPERLLLPPLQTSVLQDLPIQAAPERLHTSCSAESPSAPETSSSDPAPSISLFLAYSLPQEMVFSIPNPRRPSTSAASTSSSRHMLSLLSHIAASSGTPGLSAAAPDLLPPRLAPPARLCAASPDLLLRPPAVLLCPSSAPSRSRRGPRACSVALLSHGSRTAALVLWCTTTTHPGHE